MYYYISFRIFFELKHDRKSLLGDSTKEFVYLDIYSKNYSIPIFKYGFSVNFTLTKKNKFK